MPEPAAEEEVLEVEEVPDAQLEEVAEAPSRPRGRPARRDDEDEEERENRFRRRPKKGGVPLWVWLVSGGVGLLLLLGCCGVGGLVVWSMAGGSGPVSINNYNQLKRGMNPAQVHNILGQPTVSTPNIFGLQSETWQNGTDFIKVDFQNGTAVARQCNIQHNGWIQLQDSGLLPW